MKICVYCAKGGGGKTPIATNIVLDRGYALGTNEFYNVYEGFIPEERLLVLKGGEEFPTIPEDIDMVFDLAGSISDNTPSIRSALVQADLVIIPCCDEVKHLRGCIGTIEAIKGFTRNILVVATQLEKQKKECFGEDWKKSQGFLNVKKQISDNIDFAIHFLPLKYSKAFNAIFEQEMSIAQLSQHDPLARYNYRVLSEQFNEIYQFIDGVKANAEQKQSA